MTTQTNARVLFHAISGAGAGHVARLSVIDCALSRTRSDIERLAFSFAATSHAASFIFSSFECPVTVARDHYDRTDVARSARVFNAFVRTKAAFVPNVIVCDTYWPRPTMRRFRDSGVGTVLVLRSVVADRMLHRLAWAREDFDRIILPHDWDEMQFLYNGRNDVLRSLSKLGSAAFVGPVARVSKTRSRGPARHKRVIFCIGAGGEFSDVRPGFTVGDYIRAYRHAAHLLNRRGVETLFALGTSGRLSDDSVAPSRALRTSFLHEHFGPDTVVVSRGGYNTSWEAVAAGSCLVICGSYVGEEDIAGRAAYLEARRLATRCEISGPAIVDAVIRAINHSRRSRHSVGRNVVNRDVASIARMIASLCQARCRVSP